MDTHSTVRYVLNVLRYAYGATLILIGLDKVFQTHYIVEWTQYVSPLAQSVIPLDPATFVIVLGLAEIVVGIMFFTQWVRLAAYISIAVLAAIVIDLLNLGLYDIAARDVLIAIGVYVVSVLAGALGYTIGGRGVAHS